MDDLALLLRFKSRRTPRTSWFVVATAVSIAASTEANVKLRCSNAWLAAVAAAGKFVGGQLRLGQGGRQCFWSHRCWRAALQTVAVFGLRLAWLTGGPRARCLRPRLAERLQCSSSDALDANVLAAVFPAWSIIR